MKEKTSAQDKLYKAFIYVVLATLALLIIVAGGGGLLA